MVVFILGCWCLAVQLRPCHHRFSATFATLEASLHFPKPNAICFLYISGKARGRERYPRKSADPVQMGMRSLSRTLFRSF